MPIRTPARKLSATPTPIGGMTGFHMQAEDRTTKQMNDQPSGNLPFLKPDDIQYFDKLLVSVECLSAWVTGLNRVEKKSPAGCLLNMSGSL